MTSAWRVVARLFAASAILGWAGIAQPIKLLMGALAAAVAWLVGVYWHEYTHPYYGKKVKRKWQKN